MMARPREQIGISSSSLYLLPAGLLIAYTKGSEVIFQVESSSQALISDPVSE